MQKNIFLYILVVFMLIKIIFPKILCINRENFITPTTPFKIDVLYTWAGEFTDPNDERLSFNNELKYSLRSIILNMPWINKIFILMNPPKKKPSWIRDLGNKIIILDQKDTFPIGSKLPNKNSNAIESTMYNIKDLSEHFIYMNDDVFIGRPVKYTDFFTPEGLVISHVNPLKAKHMLKKNEMDILKIKYPLFSGWYKHIPIPYLKSYLKKYTEEYSDFINWIRSYQVRDSNCNMCKEYNLHCPCQQQHTQYMLYLYKNKMYKHKEIKCSDYKYFYHKKNIDDLDSIINNPPKYFCINGSSEVKTKMNTFFEKNYPNKAYFEF